MTIALIFLVIALVLFLLAGFNVAAPVNWIGLGLACVVAAQLVGGRVLG